MWLEEMAWIWIPLGCTAAAWMVWHVVAIAREVRALRTRVETLEDGVSSPADERPARNRAAA
jgi:hypothetical protein